MRKKCVQMSLYDTWQGVEARLTEDVPLLFRQLEEHLNWDAIVPLGFRLAFNKKYGRKRKYELESFLRAMLVQRMYGYTEDTQLLNTLRICRELRVYCGFGRVPDASKITRFKQDFCDHLSGMFERLVELTEPICRQMDEELADMLVFDTTGIENHVAENNPKFMDRKLSQAKWIARQDPNCEPYKAVYGLLPQCAAANPAVKKQYVNGHYCYAQKAAILTNGLGIVRHLALLDESFKAAHPEMLVEKRPADPAIDKEIGDSTALRPVLSDFQKAHPAFAYATFTGDAAFDSYDNFNFLLNDCGFSAAVIPINPRNPKSAGETTFDENGVPLCPRDGTPFQYQGKAGGKNRSLRLKYLCPKSRLTRRGKGFTWVCHCDEPCTPSAYGKCVYVQPHKNLRLYPGIQRGSEQWEQVYNVRTCVERTIFSLKGSLGLQGRKTSNTLTSKADLFLAGIVQLLCVLLAHALHDHSLARRPRKLIA